jgi:hypothetical protein
VLEVLDVALVNGSSSLFVKGGGVLGSINAELDAKRGDELVFLGFEDAVVIFVVGVGCVEIVGCVCGEF